MARPRAGFEHVGLQSHDCSARTGVRPLDCLALACQSDRRDIARC